jgi:hypothetical protein
MGLHVSLQAPLRQPRRCIFESQVGKKAKTSPSVRDCPLLYDGETGGGVATVAALMCKDAAKHDRHPKRHLHACMLGSKHAKPAYTM